MSAVRPPPAPGNGFTLVELLIALFLFAMLSAAATALLSFGVTARQRSAERLDELAAVTRTRALLTADLAQAAPRLWRGQDGVAQPAFTSEGDVVLGLVRRGWRNDGGARRASLQRVEYRLAGGRLERRAWPMVDGATPGVASVLVSGVARVQLRYFTEGGWRDRWAPLQPDALPAAVELTITGAGLPGLRQAFFVGPAVAG